MRYVKLASYVKIAVYSHRYDRDQYGTTHLGGVYCASLIIDCAGTIVPSIEHNMLKWSLVMIQAVMCPSRFCRVRVTKSLSERRVRVI